MWSRLQKFNEKLLLKIIPFLSDPLPKKRIEGAILITEQFRGKRDGLKAKLFFMEHGGWQALQSRMTSPSVTDAYVALAVMWNLTNMNNESCYFIGQDKATLQFIYKYCGTEGDAVEPITHRPLSVCATGALVNLTEHPSLEHRQRLIETGAVQAMDYILGIGESHARYVTCFLGLVNLVGSEETKEDPRLQSTPEIIKQIIKAVKTGNMGSGSWQKEELITPLIRLSLNDRNKKVLGQEGVVEMVYVELLGCDERQKLPGVDEEDIEREMMLRRDLLLLMQNLLFDDANIERVKATKLTELLVKWHDDTEFINKDEKLGKMVGNLAFKLGLTLQKGGAVSRASVAVPAAGAPTLTAPSGGLASTGESAPHSAAAATTGPGATAAGAGAAAAATTTTPATETTRPQVMLSYSWSNQATAIKIYQALRSRGYNIWIDVEQMKGSTIEAMASAVESSHLILVGMSRQYKESPNCRLEAEYAVSQRKGIVPLLLERDYRPDGWLGLVAGTKLWYDFSQSDIFEQRIQQLSHELDVAGARPDANDSKTMSSPKGLQPRTAVRVTDLEKWTPQQVIAWTKTVGVTDVESVIISQKVGGRAFLTMVQSAQSDQVQTMQFLERKFNLPMGPLGELMFEMRKLVLE